MDSLNKKRECSYFGKCGSCQALNLTYERELSLKMKKEISLLGRFGHVDEIIPMDNPFNYRNKVQYLMHYNGGRTQFGLYKASQSSDRPGIVSVSNCIAEDMDASAVCKTVRKLVDKYKLSVYDGRRGLIRHVMARKAFATGELLCAIVTTGEDFPAAREFADELHNIHRNVVSVSRIINTTSTHLFMDGPETILYGNGYITDTLLGCDFKISAKSFYQINPVQTEKLYSKAIEFAGIEKGERILDAYCGIGTVGIIAAKKCSAKVTGFDINSDAISNAKENTEINNVDDSNYTVCNDSAFFSKNKTHFDVVFVDPPRAGCSKSFLNCVLSHSFSKLVYISCNPETLARDIAYLNKRFKVDKIQPVDMFPGTTHVETVVLLSRKNSVDHVRVSVHSKD